MPVTEADVIEALRPVEDPELHRSIVDLDMVRDVRDRRRRRRASQVALTVAGCPLRNEIQQPGHRRRRPPSTASTPVDLDFTVMTDEERAALREKLHGDPAATAGTQPGPRPRRGPGHPVRRPVAARPACLLIASGKGGVGKSSVTTNLAVALAQRGKSVAVVDADVWGFSIPRMLGVDRPPVVIDEMLVPPEAHGVRCISMGFFAEEDQPVIWRGPMLHKALEQFLTDVFWDEPDFLVVDLPPGTGDISLSLAQFLPRAEVYVVTTPAAGRPAGRAAGRVHGREGQPRGQGRHREHVLVHRRRRQALRDLRRRRRPGRSPSGSRCRCSARCPLRHRAPRGRRLRPPDRGHRPRQRGGPGLRRASPSGSTSSWPPPAATTPSSSSL